MNPIHRDSPGADPGRALPFVFKYLVVASALFIAGCSAFFSVLGLSMLFVGSAVAVMVMASSLEVGKLVAASFLYRYWSLITIPIRIYLTLAVLVLVGITSLGNYGYLARAYERTHSQVTLLENQIASLEKEIADTQGQIDASRGFINKNSDNSREDLAALEKRIAQANDSLSQSLAGLQERRRNVQARRDRDLQVPARQVEEQPEVLTKGIASEEAGIVSLNERVDVLDRAVDAYTKRGGASFFKTDSIKLGQALREQQQPERDKISAQIAEHRQRIAELRSGQAKRVETAQHDLAAVREQSAQELARLDAEEQDLRKSHDATVAQTEQQLAALQSQGKAILTTGDTQVESLYRLIRARNEEIHQLRGRIAAVDIGSYRFVARAFEAPPDDLVKWLILALVLVFDPLAVSLVIGFNVVLLGERRSRRTLAPAPALEEALAPEAVSAPLPRRRWALAGLALLLVALLAGAVTLAGRWALRAMHNRTLTAHASLIPADSFAVLTLRPGELSRTSPDRTFAGWLGKAASQAVSNTVCELMQCGLDPGADLYAFAKFPAQAAAEDRDRPVMLCGFVARVTDPAAAETALAGAVDRLSRSLRPASNSVPELTRSRTMVRCGEGRYLEPEGNFFTFGLRGNAAILLVEFEGDPRSPRVEDEMRLCLTTGRASTDPGTGQALEQLPARAVAHDGVAALWFDAGRFFSRLPKNAAAQTRYQQLEKYLGFDMVLKVQSGGGDQLKLIADYNYQADRFNDRQQPPPLQLLAGLGPVSDAKLGGRLMDRCVDTLDFEALIERLRTALGGSDSAGAQQVVVEKAITSPRQAQFTLSARFNPKAGPPALAAMQTLFQ